jgi:cholesterol oxidase
MKYHMALNSVEGKQFYFYGYKKAGDDNAFDLWKDTTTLYTTVYGGANENAPVLGVGILKIAMGDFAIQMETMKAVNTTSMMDSLKALQAFGTLFGKDIIDTYFKKLF